MTATPDVTKVALTWSAVAGATSYVIYRNNVSAGTTLTNSYTDTSLLTETSYNYAVAAVNGGGEGTKSVAVSTKTLAE